MIYHLLALVSLLSPPVPGVARLARGIRYGALPRQRLDIYGPRARSELLPVIYFLYGGSWSLGERGYFGFAARTLAAAGFVVVVADYRLVPRAEYPAFLDDSAAGLDWVMRSIREFGGDPSRLIVMGHSAGAYNALMTVMSRLADPTAVKAMVGLSGPYDFYPFDVAISLRVFGAVRDAAATQPMAYVRPGLPPAFLAHGDRDDLVQPRNTVALAAALRAAGNSVDERHYAGVTHAGTLLQLGAWGRRGQVYADLVGFLRQHVPTEV